MSRFCKACSRGMIGFDKGTGLHVCEVEDQDFLKIWKPIRAKKTAQGILSPFQAKDFQFAYAIA